MNVSFADHIISRR